MFVFCLSIITSCRLAPLGELVNAANPNSKFLIQILSFLIQIPSYSKFFQVITWNLLNSKFWGLVVQVSLRLRLNFRFRINAIGIFSVLGNVLDSMSCAMCLLQKYDVTNWSCDVTCNKGILPPYSELQLPMYNLKCLLNQL